MNRILIGSLIAVCMSSSASAGLLEFQANAYGARQRSGEDTISAQVSWNPTVRAGLVYFRGNVGAALLKSALDGKSLAVNGQVFLGVPLFRKVALEGGGGLQSWIDHGGTHPIVSGNLVIGRNRWLGFVDRFFAGGSLFLMDGNRTKEVRAGFGFSF